MIGLIGGSGIYDSKILKVHKHVFLRTPYGTPSDKIVIGTLGKHEIAFLPRHGSKHTISPSKVNYRANIWALKKLGCTQIIGVTAVGALQENYKPGTLVITNQFIDRTYKREQTFYTKRKVCHINVSDPFCERLRKILIKNAHALKLKVHEKGTYVCVEGPRFSTRAESALYRQWNAHMIGMTACPETALAREAEICYANIAMVTDYDNLGEYGANAADIVKTMKKNVGNVQKLIKKTIEGMPAQSKCKCQTALSGALV